MLNAFASFVSFVLHNDISGEKKERKKKNQSKK